MTSVTLWSHDPYNVPHDVLMHPSILPDAQPGDLAQLSLINMAGEKRALCFTVGHPTESANVQVSVSSSILSLLGVHSRSTAVIKLKTKESLEVDTVELRFKGAYLTRADLYRISKQLTSQCLRIGQRVPFLGGSIRLQVVALWRNGKRKFSGYVDPDTHIVYRSDSARIILLIQLSVEMWDFDETGEIGFQKLVGSFIPESLRQWNEQGAQHTITVILFTSLSGSNRKSRLLPGELEPNPQNYYRVAVDAAPVQSWSDILSTLRREFVNFKSILMGTGERLPDQPLAASKGNILDALKYTTSFTSSKFSDRDLCRTNLQVTVISASPGLFDVDEMELYQISKLILSVEIGVELVCLSRPPLHMTPMFRAKTAGGGVNHYIPTWMNISFWGSTERYVKQWIPRCKIYDIQMMGIMENEMKAISVRHLPHGKLTTRFMKKYDSNIFRSGDGLIVDTAEVRTEQPVESTKPSLLSASPTPPRPFASSTVAQCESVTAEAPAAPTFATNGDGKSIRGSLDALLKSSTRRSVRHVPSLSTIRSSLSSAISISDKQRPPSIASVREEPLVQFPNQEPPKLQPTRPSLQVQLPSKPSKPSKPVDPVDPVAPAPAGGQEPGEGEHLPPSWTRKRSQSRSIPIPMPSRGQAPQMPRAPGYHPHNSQSSASPGSRLKKIGSPNRSSRRGTVPTITLAPKPPVSVASPGNMWRKLSSPSLIDHPSRTEAYGRWAYVFPKGAKKGSISWNSINSPASLPLTSDVFPTATQFNNEYKFQFYDLAIIPDANSLSTPHLLDELIGSRLQMGFQIAVGDAVAKVEAASPGGNPALLKQIVPQDNFVGVRLYMIRQETIHRLCIEQDDLINVRIYSWVNPDQRLAQGKPQYKADIYLRTKYETVARKLENVVLNPLGDYKINWNLADQQLLGLVDQFNNQAANYAKTTRFAVIPVRPSNKNEDQQALEDQRIDGILKIVNFILKHQTPPKPLKARGLVPEVVFYTGFLNNATESLFLESELSESSRLQPQSDRLDKSISHSGLLEEIKGKWGPKIQTKRWHWRTLKNILIGEGFVTWLVHNFGDIASREEAVKYAQQLLDDGFLVTQNNGRKFTDGYFFYELAGAGEPAEPVPQTAPSSPTSPGPASSSDPGPGPKTRIALTRSLKIDLDLKNVSPRPEVCRVHIDRFHNTEHAFNIRAEWLNATPRLVDDFFTTISRICNNSALKLVQVPHENIANADRNSPFRSSSILSFCIDPLSVVADKTQFEKFPLFFHHFFLRRMGFVFDGTGINIPNQRFHLDYSWKNSHHQAQYIHHSGSVIVQIQKDRSFYMAPNTIFLSRYVSGPAPQVGVEDSIQSMFTKVCENPDILEEIFEEAARLETMSPAATPPPTD